MKGTTFITILVITFIVVSQGRYCGRMHSTVHSFPKVLRDSSCGCSDDIGALLSLVRALEEKDCSCDTPPASNGSINNADNLIMNLVNALIQITSQALNRNNCQCPNQGTNNPNPNNNGGTGNNPQNGGSGYSNGDGGLLNLDLLNPNKKDNVLDLDLAKQHLIGVGIGAGGGGGSSQGSNNYYPSGRNANGGNDEGLVNVDLLNPNKKSNVAEVDIAKQNVVGVGLGGGGTAPPVPTPSKPTSTANSGTVSSSSGSDTGEGLINVDVLNPNKPDNVAEVDIAKKNVVGVGLGDKKDDLIQDKIPK